MKPLRYCGQRFHLVFSTLAFSFALLVALPTSLEVYAQPCPSANYRLQTQAQVDAFPGGCTEVTGGVHIGPSEDIADLLPLAGITTVRGNVSLTGNAVLTNVGGFSALTTIGDTLVIGGDLDHGRYNPALTNLDGFSGLSSVGTLYISQFAGTRLVFSALTSVDNRVTIRESEALTYLDLSSLRFVDGWDLGIEHNVSLTHVDLSALIRVGGTIQIWWNDALARLDLPALTTLGKPGRNEAIPSNLNIWRNAAMSSVNLSQLETVETLAIHENAALSRIDLPALRSAKSLYIVDNSSLTGLSASGILSLGRLTLDNNPALTSFDFSSLTTVKDELLIRENDALVSFDLSALASVEGSLVVNDNEALTGFDLTGLASVASLDVGGAALTHFDFPVLTTACGLRIGPTTALVDFDLTALTQVCRIVRRDGRVFEGRLIIADNTSLVNLNGLSSLNSVMGWLYVGGNYALENLAGLAGVTSVGGYVDIHSNQTLATLDGLSGISSVGGFLSIYDNAILESLGGLSGLTSVAGDLDVFDNDALTNLDGFQQLTSVEGDVTVYDNDTLSACSCGLYTLVGNSGVGGSVSMYSNAASGDCNNDGADLVAGQCGAVRIEEQSETTVPTEYALYAAYPDPFNATTTISYALPQAADVTLTVVDLLGRTVSEVTSGTQPAGTYEVTLDAIGLPSGVYFYSLGAGGYIGTKRMVVAR